jgi:GT2 family glycosyltransferase
MVVVTRDRPHLLRGTLDALAAQSWEPREVVVVDNGGDGATAALCREYALRLVPAAGRTLGAARQAGVEAARGAIIAFTDDDCLPDRRWLEELVRALQVDPSLRGVQGRTETEPGSLLAHGVRVSRGGHLFETCNMAYRREALEEAGGFDPAYRGWFEDTALGAEVLRRGRIGFAPAALVVHRSVARPAMDRKRWRVLLEDERRLARGHPAFYRRTRGPGFLPAVTMHWLVGSPLKRIARALPRAWREPREFAALLRTLLWERRELIAALRDERSADQR